jgi:hypothetical protein
MEVGVGRREMVLVLALAWLDSQRTALVARGRDARPGCSGVWCGTTQWLGERRRGGHNISEKKKKVLLTCSTAARIRVLRRVHVGSGYRWCTVTTESSCTVSCRRALATDAGR